jgi:flagellar basal-body rod modification protein FlgD
MVGGVGRGGAEANVAVPGETLMGASAGPGGLLSQEKDAKVASTEAKLGEALQNIQAKYGAKPAKAREIKKTLDKDDFLKIMITQMKHQDPTSPFKADEMAARMAQFTSVEQLQNVNQNLAKLQGAQRPLEQLAMTNLIGKIVTIDRERFPHTEGTNEALSFVLPKDAAHVKLTIVSEAGETVLEKDLGPQKAGDNSFTWDGKKQNTLPAKGGTYMFRVAAVDDKGMSLQTDSRGQARVIGLSFQGSEPVFLVGDAQHQQKVTMKNIVQIESDASGGAAPAAAAGPGGGIKGSAGAGTQPPKASNFISFQKGVGSSNLDPLGADPEVAQAIAAYQQRMSAEKAGEGAQEAMQRQLGGAGGANGAALGRNVAAAAARAPAPEERGFPNGLQDSGPAVNLNDVSDAPAAGAGAKETGGSAGSASPPR